MANEEIKDKLDQFHYHEALDRLHVVMSMCDEHLMQHPVIKIESSVKQNVNEAIKLLWQAYQEVGHMSDKKFNNE
jgi:hypothetical protein